MRSTSSSQGCAVSNAAVAVVRQMKFCQCAGNNFGLRILQQSRADKPAFQRAVTLQLIVLTLEPSSFLVPFCRGSPVTAMFPNGTSHAKRLGKSAATVNLGNRAQCRSAIWGRGSPNTWCTGWCKLSSLHQIASLSHSKLRCRPADCVGEPENARAEESRECHSLQYS